VDIAVAVGNFINSTHAISAVFRYPHFLCVHLIKPFYQGNFFVSGRRYFGSNLPANSYVKFVSDIRIEFFCPVKLRYLFQEQESLYLERDC
jgi:hypothetical protein